MKKELSRRELLGTGGRTAAGVAAGLSLSGLVRDVSAQAAPNNRFNVALIGCGGMGRYKLGNFMDTRKCDIVAVCDVDDSQAAGAAADVTKKLGTTPKQTRNCKEVLDMKDLDVVIVATPDHWHAAPMMAAVAAGKHVYCEKPCCHNIREGRAMVDAAKKYKRVVQVGTHQRSMDHVQKAREYIQAGKLGTISMTETYTYGNDAPKGLGEPKIEPVPAGVDYDMWQGAAALQPGFNRHRFHNTWRWFFDYASGMVGDWNVHLQDIIMWSMNATHADAVSTSGGKFVLEDDRTTPDTMLTSYDFGPVDLAPKGFVHLYTMRKASGRPWNADGYGMVFHGTNGKLHLTRGRWSVEPDAKDWNNPGAGNRTEGFKTEAPGADQVAHLKHVENFLDCVVSGKSPIASIEKHYNTVVACHLANVSLKAGRQVFWNAESETLYSDRGMTHEDQEAARLLTREYRKGYELPQV